MRLTVKETQHHKTPIRSALQRAASRVINKNMRFLKYLIPLYNGSEKIQSNFYTIF